MTVHNVTKEWTNETTERQTQRNGVSSRLRISALRLKMTSTNALSSLVGKRWLRLDLVKGRIQPSAYNRVVAFFQDTAFEPGPVIFANPPLLLSRRRDRWFHRHTMTIFHDNIGAAPSENSLSTRSPTGVALGQYLGFVPPHCVGDPDFKCLEKALVRPCLENPTEKKIAPTAAQRSFNSTHTSALGKFLHFQLTMGQDVPRSFRFHVSAIFRRHDLSGTKDARFFGASLKQYDLAGRLVTNSRVGARHDAENQI